MNNILLTSDRLILRHITPNDDYDMFEYSSSNNIGPNAGWKPHSSIRETRKMIRELYIPQKYFFGIVLKENNKLIGAAGLCHDFKRDYDRVKMLGFALNEDFQHKGYALEACKQIIKFGFENLDLEMISCYCYPYNLQSSSLIKRLGFSYEGRLSLCEKRYDGIVFDNDCYHLTKSEYKSHNVL